MRSKISLLLLITVVELITLVPHNDASLEIKHTLRVASELSPRLLGKSAENGRYNKYKGFVKDFCEELVNILGYQYEIILPHDDHRQGGQARNSSSIYGGDIFGMLLRNEADLAFGDTEITMERAQNFDFSSPVLNTRFAILYREDNVSISIATSQWTIFSPFPVTVWIPFIVISILYFGFLKFHQLRPNRFQLSSFQNLKYSRKFARISLLIWMGFLFTSYISNFSAQKFLQASAAKDIRPENLVDLASQKDVKIGWLARGPVERFFRNTVNELYQKVYMQHVGRDWVSSVNEGVNKVLNENGKFAFILDSLAADHETQLDCRLYKLPQEFGPVRPIAVVTPIGSPLRERINQAVLSLSEQGIIEALHSRWFSSIKNGFCSAETTQQKLITAINGSLQEMSPIFIVAVLGLFLATIVGALEIQFLRRKLKSPQPKPPRQHVELLPKFNLESV